MKQSILVFFLCCAMLSGCASKQAPEAIPAIPPDQIIPEPIEYYDSEHPLEAATGGALRCYPLAGQAVTGMIPLEQGLLLFSQGEVGTRLSVLEGPQAQEQASLELDYVLSPQDPSLRIHGDGFSFYQPNTREVLVLDAFLQPIACFPAPSELTATPLLSYDRSTLYYCTANAIRVLDLNSGVSRCLKEIPGNPFSITGLWLEDTILECRTEAEGSSQVLFLSTQNGQIQYQSEIPLTFSAGDTQFYAGFPNGPVISRVFGTKAQIQAFHVDGDCFFLPEVHGAVTLSRTEEKEIVLEYFDLNSGHRTSSLTLNTAYSPWNIVCAEDGHIQFLLFDETRSCQTLFSWDIAATYVEDSASYTDTYYTSASPDTEGLARCQAYAAEIGAKYGIEVTIYQDAALVQPWDFDLEPEYLVPVIEKELSALDIRLGNYPDGFFRVLSAYFDGIRICIVRSITGTAESGRTDSVSGIQFMDGYTACIAVSTEKNTEYALYHELCHLIDTVVITGSGAYDRWDQLNPKGFEYDYDYSTNQARNSDEYLQPSNRSFIDTFSMSFPKEDRARIMEYAMTPENEDYFVSLTMQAKLKLLCEGIREAFRLKKSPETFLWEQYLNTSLAYTE